MKEIKLRYQLTKNFQVVEVKATVPIDKVKEVKGQLLELAKEELKKIANVNEGIPNKSPAKTNTNFNQELDPNAIAKNSKGYDSTSQDRIKLTNADVAKCRENRIQFWKVTKATIDSL